MTARPHDALFKSAFEAASAARALLCEVLPPQLRDALVWDTLKPETGSYIDPELADSHSDLLFSIRLRNTHDVVYALLEHQSTRDPAMPLRALEYHDRIWGRFRKGKPAAARLPPIITVIVSHVPGGWTTARSFDELFEPAVLNIPALAAVIPRFSLIVDDLAHRSNEDLEARSLGAFQKLALW